MPIRGPKSGSKAAAPAKKGPAQVAEEEYSRTESENEQSDDVTEDSRENDHDCTDEEESDDDSGSEGSSQESASAAEELDEGESSYKPGGYHRVHIGDVFANRWQVERKLGWGHFSTVWLVKHLNGRPAALKVQKSAKNYTDAAHDEIKILNKCKSAEDTSHRGKRFIVQLLDSFSHAGPNGHHMVMVFELLGDNLLSLVSYYDYKGIPLHIVRQISWQILAGLDFLHRQCKIIHCDLKLENILIAGLSTDYARKIASGMKCVARLRLNVNSSDVQRKSDKQEVINGREETLRHRLESLNRELAAARGANERRNIKRKLERTKAQLTELVEEPKANVSHSDVEPSSSLTAEDDSTEWKTVKNKASSTGKGRAQIMSERQRVSLLDSADLASISDKLFRRNLEMLSLPYEVQDASPDPATRATETSNSNKTSSPMKSPIPSPASLVSLAISVTKFNDTVNASNGVNQDSDGEIDSFVIGYVLLSEQTLCKAIAQELISKEQNDGDFHLKNNLSFREVNRNQSDVSIRNALLEGWAAELGVPISNLTTRSKAKHKRGSAKTEAALILFRIESSESLANSLLALQEAESWFEVIFLFSSRALVVPGQAVPLGIPWKTARLSGDISFRPFSQRVTPELPPSMPKFIGSDLNIHSSSPLDIAVKIVDLGNACWTFKHFADEIQTRQYRAPEVILGADYSTSADIWSFACVVFELITGDFLFDPSSGKTYSRDEDHLALITELVGPIPKSDLKGSMWKKFYKNDGTFMHIKDLDYSSLYSLLTKRYKIDPKPAKRIAEFLEPCLLWSPHERASAERCLRDPFVSGLVG